MSLINDALNRARAEAARREAAERGELVPPIEPPPRRGAPWRPVALILGLVLVVATGLVLRGGSRQPGSPGVELAGGRRSEPVAAPTSGALSVPTTAEPTVVSPPASTPPPATAVPSRTPDQAPAPQSTAPPAPLSVAAPPREAQPTPREAPALVPSAVAPSAAAPAAAAPAPRATAPSEASADDTWYYVGEVELAEGTLELGGIAWSSSSPLAMVNGALVRVGDEILGFVVTDIAPRTVTLEGRGRRIALQLDAARE